MMTRSLPTVGISVGKEKRANEKQETSPKLELLKSPTAKGPFGKMGPLRWVTVAAVKMPFSPF